MLLTVCCAEKVIPQAVNYYTLFAIANASFADITDTTEELAVTNSTFMSYVGWGVLVAPLIAAQIVTMTGNIMSSYQASLFFNVALIGTMVGHTIQHKTISKIVWETSIFIL